MTVVFSTIFFFFLRLFNFITNGNDPFVSFRIGPDDLNEVIFHLFFDDGALHCSGDYFRCERFCLLFLRRSSI